MKSRYLRMWALLFWIAWLRNAEWYLVYFRFRAICVLASGHSTWPAFTSMLRVTSSLSCAKILWLGLPPLMQAPRQKALPYAAAVVVCAVILAIVLGAIQAAIFVSRSV